MAVTQNTYTGNGATVLYSFTFPYLETTDVKVTINGTPTTAYTFANATTIQFNTAPANGAAIRIYRDTDDASLAATFYSGSAIRAQDLNDNFTQNLYVTQEVNNNSVNIDGSNPMAGNLNLNNFKVVNLGTPTVATDASTKGYVDSVIATGAANAAAAASSASAAAGSATAAANSLDSFDDRYLGAKTTDPLVDNDGNALLVGAIYFNSTSKVMRVWNGANWQDSSANANVLRWRKTAVGGETTLSGNDNSSQSLTYTVNLETVFLNGALLQRGVDYVATTGNSITGLVALTAGDVVEVLAFSQVSLLAIPSSTVTFTQSGTGSTQRTVESKLKDVVSVKDFGAVGNGVADDTAAIQAAVIANPGKMLLLPSGTYKITATISQTVSGADAAVTGFVGDGSTQTIIDNQSSGPAFKVDSGTGAAFAYDACFENLQIKSTGSQAGTIGIQLDGCRLASIRNVRILGQGLHGIYAYSTVGDFTDTAQILIEQTEILNCGGYGIYASTNTSGIQYNWNLYQVRVGSCALGGVLYESMINAVIESCGIFYNQNFGLKITRPAGGNLSKIIRVANTEFDNNVGVQLDVDSCVNFTSNQLYLVANSANFTKGVVLGAEVTTAVLNQTSPRLDPALTGINVIELEAGAVDVVARDTDYTGYSISNGNMYVDNTAGAILAVDDRLNRITTYTGTYTVTVGNLSNATTSPTTVTGYYSVTGKSIIVGFRNLNSIDITGFPGSSIITFTLPKACITANVGFVGNAIVTTDAGSANPPIPVTENGSTKAYMRRLGTGSFLTQADLTSGVSSVPHFTINYIIA